MRNRIAALIGESAARDPSVVFLTGDLGYSVVEPLAEQLGERFINMGIAEANMVSVAASLAACGLKPFAYSIVPFITARCLEQIRNDVIYQDRAVRLIGVGSGFSYGTLGPSHHALEDASLMAALPGLIIFNPGNRAELDRVHALGMDLAGPSYTRVARESGDDYPVPDFSLDGGAFRIRAGQDVSLVTSGVSTSECLAAARLLEAKGIEANVVSVPVLAPFPSRKLSRLLGSSPVVTVFEGYRGNPLSVGVMELVLSRGMRNAFVDLCAPSAFAATVGGTEFLRRRAGLDAASIAAAAERSLAPRRAAAG